MVDFGATQEKRETDVPEGLEAGAKDADGMDVYAAVKYHGCGEGGPEAGNGRGGEEGVGATGCGEEG